MNNLSSTSEAREISEEKIFEIFEEYEQITQDAKASKFVENKDAVVIAVVSEMQKLLYWQSENLKEIFDGIYGEDCFDNGEEIPDEYGLYIADVKTYTDESFDGECIEHIFEAYVENIRPFVSALRDRQWKIIETDGLPKENGKQFLCAWFAGDRAVCSFENGDFWLCEKRSMEKVTNQIFAYCEILPLPYLPEESPYQPPAPEKGEKK